MRDDAILHVTVIADENVLAFVSMNGGPCGHKDVFADDDETINCCEGGGAVLAMTGAATSGWPRM